MEDRNILAVAKRPKQRRFRWARIVEHRERFVGMCSDYQVIEPLDSSERIEDADLCAAPAYVLRGRAKLDPMPIGSR